MSSPWNCDRVLVPWNVSRFETDLGDSYLYLLVHDDRHRVIQNAFTENDGVKFGCRRVEQVCVSFITIPPEIPSRHTVDFVCVEDGQDCDWIGCRQGRTEDQALEQSKLETLETQERPYVDQDSEYPYQYRET